MIGIALFLTIYTISLIDMKTLITKAITKYVFNNLSIFFIGSYSPFLNNYYKGVEYTKMIFLTLRKTSPSIRNSFGTENHV